MPNPISEDYSTDDLVNIGNKDNPVYVSKDCEPFSLASNGGYTPNPIEDKEQKYSPEIRSIVYAMETMSFSERCDLINHKLAEFKKQIVSSCAKEFDELCKKVHTDSHFGNSSKGKKDNFLDGAEVMLTHIQCINQLKEKK